MKRLFALAFIVLVLAGAAAYLFVPWDKILKERITTFLNAKGLQNIEFTIDSVGIHQATISGISVGKNNPMLLKSVSVEYSPKELLDGNVRDIVLSGLDIHLTQTEEGWSVVGLEDIKRGGGSAARMTLSDLVEILPFAAVRVENSTLRIAGNSVQTALPFNLQFVKAPVPRITMNIDAANLTAVSSDISLGIIMLEAEMDQAKHWNGTWTLASMDMGEALPLKPMGGGGTLAYTGDAISFDGTMNSEDKTQPVSFKTIIDLNDDAKNALTLTSAALPFKEGTVSTKNVIIPFNRSKNITVNLAVRKVSLDALMQTLTGKRVTATGTVSGNMPVILRPDGSYTLGKGVLKADSSGLIQMPGEAIPGNNEQVALVREIVENLHYSVFSAAVDTSGKEGLVVRLSLEGNNPDVYNGRIVKLNVNLTGDVLDFIQQNAMLITSPERLLRQGIE